MEPSSVLRWVKKKIEEKRKTNEEWETIICTAVGKKVFRKKRGENLKKWGTIMCAALGKNKLEKTRGEKHTKLGIYRLYCAR